MKTSLEDLVARCIEALEHGDRAVVDELCESHPEHAIAIRRRLARLDRSGLLSSSERSEPIEIPDQVGPYRTLRPLGHGGMGSVFLAEQSEPVQRQVALKVIKLGMDSREVLARFERERQALARMNHPHIAPVYDTGLTEQGRPYFAMEYVPGEPITTFCAQRELPIEERLNLLAQVCDAVQHAHHKGVIHRDLKPSNLLVTQRDGTAVAKVIDFGLAKAIAHEVDGAQRTEGGQIVGTPEYMSPEQAGHAEVDSRTDVYALGVVLYELLTGLLPFEASRLRDSVDEWRRIVREEEPPTPSRRVSTRGSIGDDPQAPRDHGRLRRRLRGELDWITLKALAKDRDERYPTPHDLAEDLRRHLNNEPVQAGPPSDWYRVRKFVRRYRVPVTASAAVLLALIVGLITSLVFYSQARASALRANVSYRGALDAVDQMLTRVGDERLAEVPHTERVRRDLLQDALRFYREFLADRQGDDGLRLRVASAHGRVASILGLLGMHKDAEAEYERAIDELSLLEPTTEQRSALAAAKVGLANVQRLLTPDAGTERLLLSAVAEFSSLRTADENDLRHTIGEAGAQYGLGFLLMRTDPARARTAFERAVELTAQVKDKTGARDDRLRWAEYRVDLADCLDVAGERDTARAELRAARSEVEALLDLHPGELDLRIALARTCEKLALLLARHDDGGTPLEESVGVALSIRESLVREFPSLPKHRESVALLLALRASALFRRKKFDAATETFREAVDAGEALAQQYPDIARYRQRLAGALYEFGRMGVTVRAFGSRRSTTETEAALRRALELYRELHRAEPEVMAHRQSVAGTCDLLAELLFEERELDEAAALIAEQVSLLRGLISQHPDRYVYHRRLSDAHRLWGRILHAQGDHAAAERALRAATEHLEHAIDRGGPPGWRQAFGPIYEHLAEAQLAQGRFRDAADAAQVSADAAPQQALARETAAKTLLECRRLALEQEREPLGRTYAECAVEHARAAEAAQAKMHARVGTMNKYFISRARTTLLLARAQFAASAVDAARASVKRAAAHAKAAWEDKTTGFGPDRLRAFYQRALELLREHDASDAATELTGDLRRALGQDG